jgi:hypothetical protein
MHAYSAIRMASRCGMLKLSIMLKPRLIFCILAIFFGNLAASQTTSLNSIEEFCRKNQTRLLKQYFTFLAIPNLSSDQENIGKNAAWILDALTARGLTAELLKATTPNTPPAVYAEWNQPGAKRTILFYAHYDGQPVKVPRSILKPEFTRDPLPMIRPAYSDC